MDGFMAVKEAADAVGVSRFTIWRLIREGKIEAYQSQRDRRERLVNMATLHSILKPQPINLIVESSKEKS